jgi:hypothetical protein
MLQSPSDLSAFATNEQVDAIMLNLEDLEETVSKGRFGAFTLAGNGDGFVGTGSGVVFYEIFKIIVIDVVCDAWSVATVQGDGHAMTSVGTTNSDPIAGQISASTVGRTS